MIFTLPYSTNTQQSPTHKHTLPNTALRIQELNTLLNSCTYSVTVTELLVCVKHRLASYIFGGEEQELANEQGKIEKK